MKNAFGLTKYSILQKVVKICLSVLHNNADIERGVLLSIRILSEDKTNVSERPLNAKLYIVDAFKHYNYEINLIPITHELLLLSKSMNKNYKEHLKVEERKKEKRRADETR